MPNTNAKAESCAAGALARFSHLPMRREGKKKMVSLPRHADRNTLDDVVRGNMWGWAWWCLQRSSDSRLSGLGCLASLVRSSPMRTRNTCKEPP